MRKAILIFGHDYGTQFVDIYNQYTLLFDPQKYEVTVAYLCGEENAAVRKKTIAENVVFMNISKKAIKHLKIKPIQQLIKLFHEKKFTMVISHRYKPTYMTLVAKQFSNIPVTISVMHEFKTFKAFGRRLLIQIFGRNNTILAGVSNAIRDDLRQSLQRMNHEKIITLYNMVDVDRTEAQYLAREAARKALQLSSEDFIFGNLARLVPNKNLSRLIEAFAEIKPKCPRAKLIILGEGPLRNDLQAKISQLKLENQVLLPGFVSDGFKYMRAFDGFILPSVQEAFGRVLLEAMLAKVPVIASKIHGIPEVVGDTQILIDPFSVRSIADAMQAFYDENDRNRLELATSGYIRVTNCFSIPQFIQQFWQHPLIAKIENN